MTKKRSTVQYSGTEMAIQDLILQAEPELLSTVGQEKVLIVKEREQVRNEASNKRHKTKDTVIKCLIYETYMLSTYIELYIGVEQPYLYSI